MFELILDSLALFLLVYSIITHRSSSLTFLSLQELLNCGEDLDTDQIRTNIAILHAALKKLAAGCDDELKFYIVALDETNLNYLIAMLERALVSNERCFLMALMACCRRMETFGAPITHNKPVTDCCPTTKNFTTLFAAVVTPEALWASSSSPHAPAVLANLQQEPCVCFWNMLPCCPGDCPDSVNSITRDMSLAILAAVLTAITCAGFYNEMLVQGNIAAGAVLGKEVNSTMYGSTYSDHESAIAAALEARVQANGGAGPSSTPSSYSRSAAPGLDKSIDKTLSGGGLREYLGDRFITDAVHFISHGVKFRTFAEDLFRGENFRDAMMAIFPNAFSAAVLTPVDELCEQFASRLPYALEHCAYDRRRGSGGDTQCGFTLEQCARGGRAVQQYYRDNPHIPNPGRIAQARGTAHVFTHAERVAGGRKAGRLSTGREFTTAERSRGGNAIIRIKKARVDEFKSQVSALEFFELLSGFVEQSDARDALRWFTGNDNVKYLAVRFNFPKGNEPSLFEVAWEEFGFVGSDAIRKVRFDGNATMCRVIKEKFLRDGGKWKKEAAAAAAAAAVDAVMYGTWSEKDNKWVLRIIS